jgi:long-chain fatty acid transport protein
VKIADRGHCRRKNNNQDDKNNNQDEKDMKTITESALTALAVAGAMLAAPGNAAASAFALIEQTSGAGNAYAGGAAAAEDASTIWFNPAGMTRLSDQVTVAGNVIRLSTSFSDGGTAGAALQTAGGNGGEAGGTVFVPNTYMVKELQPALRFGLGIFMPFGLQTDYDPTWIGRFQAIKSKIQTVNLNPSLAYQVNDSISVGAGLNYQHISGELTSAVNYSAAAFGTAAYPFVGANNEGVTSMTGSDSAWGYNLGVMVNVMPNARIGVSYRSKVKYDLKGSVVFSSVPTALATAPALQNGDVSMPIDMPDSISISAFHHVSEDWDFMADATRTGWSSIQELVISRPDGTVVQATPEHWKNTWRVAVGATRHFNEQWLGRVGFAYDQTPVPDAYRTARIPDSDRTWVTIGGGYKTSASGMLSFAYVHVFMKNASIASDQTATGAGNLVGSYSNSVDILSMQYVYKF